MKRPFGLPLGVSIAGHCCILLALILFFGRIPLLISPPVAQKEGIEVMLAPVQPIAPPQPAPPPPPIPELPPPPPPPPVVQPTPPPPPPPRPEHRVIVRPPPRRPPPERQIVQPQYQPPPTPYVPPTSYMPQTAPQTTAIPRPAPAPPRPAAPLISAGYRAELSAWLAGHKRYPESARERSEEGQAVLRFRVDRSGRVLSYSVVGSTGYPDLDAAVDAMMRGAVLPPFPPDMTANDVEVTVAVRFSLVR